MELKRDEGSLQSPVRKNILARKGWCEPLIPERHRTSSEFSFCWLGWLNVLVQYITQSASQPFPFRSIPCLFDHGWTIIQQGWRRHFAAIISWSAILFWGIFPIQPVNVIRGGWRTTGQLL